MKMLLTIFLVSSASFADCTALLSDAIAWANTHDGRNAYYVGFQIASMKAPAKFTSFAAGAFVVRGAVLAADRVSTSFSDRTWCPDTPAGSFCLGNQHFNYHAQDQMSFTLDRTGLLTVVLNTWGNATYRVPLQCSNGFLFGTLVEGNGNSMLMLNLNKYSQAIPR